MKAKDSPLFSKGKDDWQTPKEVFDALHEEFHFDCDVAADEENRLCKNWLGPGHQARGLNDALTISWAMLDIQRAWCNPPYSMVEHFVAKAALEADSGVTTVMLIPSRTDTRWFHEHIWDVDKGALRPHRSIRFFKGRLKFIDPANPENKNSAPFPSMLVIFHGV